MWKQQVPFRVAIEQMALKRLVLLPQTYWFVLDNQRLDNASKTYHCTLFSCNHQSAHPDHAFPLLITQPPSTSRSLARSLSDLTCDCANHCDVAVSQSVFCCDWVTVTMLLLLLLLRLAQRQRWVGVDDLPHAEVDFGGGRVIVFVSIWSGTRWLVDAHGNRLCCIPVALIFFEFW